LAIIQYLALLHQLLEAMVEVRLHHINLHPEVLVVLEVVVHLVLVEVLVLLDRVTMAEAVQIMRVVVVEVQVQ
jgi:hypothetical protein